MFICLCMSSQKFERIFKKRKRVSTRSPINKVQIDDRGLDAAVETLVLYWIGFLETFGWRSSFYWNSFKDNKTVVVDVLCVLTPTLTPITALIVSGFSPLSIITVCFTCGLLAFKGFDAEGVHGWAWFAKGNVYGRLGGRQLAFMWVHPRSLLLDLHFTVIWMFLVSSCLLSSASLTICLHFPQCSASFS